MAQPTTRREKASTTTARNPKARPGGDVEPAPAKAGVMSATQRRSGASAVKSRSTRSQAGRAFSARTVVRVPRHRPHAGDPGDPHQPLDALAPHAHARLAQRGRGRAASASGRVRCGVDRPDPGRRLGVRHGAGGGPAMAPGVEAGSRETPSTRAIVAMGKQAWFAVVNSRTSWTSRASREPGVAIVARTNGAPTATL